MVRHCWEHRPQTYDGIRFPGLRTGFRHWEWDSWLYYSEPARWLVHCRYARLPGQLVRYSLLICVVLGPEMMKPVAEVTGRKH